MKERLLAERAAQRDTPPPTPPAAKPAAAPSAASRASAQAASTPARPVASEKPSVAARVGSAPAKTASAAEPAGAGRAGRGASRAGREKTGAREKGASRQRGAAGRKGPLPLLLACVGLLAASGAVYWFVLRPKPASVETPPATEQQAASAGQSIPPAPQAQAADANAAASPSAPAGAGPGALAAAPETPKAAAPKTPEPADPSSIDLGALPTFERFPGTSDEEWQLLQAQARAMLDFSGGAAQTRAMNNLQTAGRKAFPAILNAFKDLDLATESGVQAGKLCQRTLMNICNGTNFGWKDGIDPASIVFNKKVVQSWSTQWERCKTDDPESNAYWAKFSKSEAKQGAKPAAEDDSGSALDEI
jgi:hypothetical protein